MNHSKATVTFCYVILRCVILYAALYYVVAVMWQFVMLWSVMLHFVMLWSVMLQFVVFRLLKRFQEAVPFSAVGIMNF